MLQDAERPIASWLGFTHYQGYTQHFLGEKKKPPPTTTLQTRAKEEILTEKQQVWLTNRSGFREFLVFGTFYVIMLKRTVVKKKNKNKSSDVSKFCMEKEYNFSSFQLYKAALRNRTQNLMFCSLRVSSAAALWGHDPYCSPRELRNTLCFCQEFERSICFTFSCPNLFYS